MKIEKLTENKIRIILNTKELTLNNIDITDFINNNIQSQKFFLDVLNKAEKELGFYTENCKLLIEAFSSLNELFIFTITKLVPQNKKKNSIKLKEPKKSKFIQNTIYKFNSIEDFCILCNFIQKNNLFINNIAKKISLYYYNNTYYLIFTKINLSYRDLKKVFSIMSEFAFIITKPHNFESKIFEYGKPIIKQNALQTGIKYFI